MNGDLAASTLTTKNAKDDKVDEESTKHDKEPRTLENEEVKENKFKFKQTSIKDYISLRMQK